MTSTQSVAAASTSDGRGGAPAPRIRRARTRGLNRTVSNALWRIAVVAFAVFAWWLVTTTGLMSSRAVSSPQEVIQILIQWFGSGSIYPQLLQTVQVLVLGWLLGTAIGMAIGFLFAYLPLVAAVFGPVMSMVNAMPRAALAPLFIIWFGLGMRSGIALAVMLVVVQPFLNTYRGLLEIDPRIVANARILGAGNGAITTNVYLPAVRAWVLASLDVTLGLAFIGAIIGEYLGSNTGLGFLLSQSQAVGSIGQMVAVLWVMIAIAIVIKGGLGAVVSRFGSARVQ